MPGINVLTPQCHKQPTCLFGTVVWKITELGKETFNKSIAAKVSKPTKELAIVAFAVFKKQLSTIPFIKPT